MRFGRVYVVVFLTVLTLMLVGGATWVWANNGEIHACVAEANSENASVNSKGQATGGSVRIVGSAEDCRDDEAHLTWSIVGPAGADGTPGDDGADGLSCWDLNGNRTQDADEDKNGDGAIDALDCKGDKGEKGDPGADADPAQLALLQDQIDDLEGRVSELEGGFCKPTQLAVAYIEVDEIEGYNTESDTRIIEVVDTDCSGGYTVGDEVYLTAYPTTMDPVSSVQPFNIIGPMKLQTTSYNAAGIIEFETQSGYRILLAKVHRDEETYEQIRIIGFGQTNYCLFIRDFSRTVDGTPEVIITYQENCPQLITSDINESSRETNNTDNLFLETIFQAP